MKFLNKIKLVREANRVERCHMVPKVRPYSVGHHTADVVGLVTFTWREAHDGELPRAELLLAALFHDTPERKIGDIPSPTKKRLDAKILGELEDEVLEALQVDFDLTEEEAVWLYHCDVLELLLWAREELELFSNQNVQGMINNINEWMKDKTFHPIHDNIIHYYSSRRLSEELREIYL